VTAFRGMNRELPPPLEYINARLTRRPIHTYLWLIWSIGCYSYVLSEIADSSGRGAGRALLFAIIGGVFAAFFVVKLVISLGNEVDRKWLFSIYRPEENKRVALDTRIAVGLVPMLGSIALIQYLFFRD